MDSFDEMLDYGLKCCTKRMVPLRFRTPAGEKVELKITDINIARPQVPLTVIDVKDRYTYPTEARQLHDTYAGMCTVRVEAKVNGLELTNVDVDLGTIPIMLKSKACNLHKLSPEQMVEKGEHDTDWGGIFIVKGNEKIIRMLLMSRRNYPIAVKRSTWKDRGSNFSELGIMVRTVRDDETSFNNVLHYLHDGSAKFMFSQMKFMSYVPICLILRCLVDYSDQEIYKRLVRGYEHDQYYLSSVQNMLRDVHDRGLHTSQACRNYMGQIFRNRFPEVPEWEEDAAVTDFIMKQRVLVHLDTFKEKFDLLVFMVQKLFQCAQEAYKIENVDGVMMQEVLQPGILILYLKLCSIIKF